MYVSFLFLFELLCVHLFLALMRAFAIAIAIANRPPPVLTSEYNVIASSSRKRCKIHSLGTHKVHVIPN
jgi:hypothetical protein